MWKSAAEARRPSFQRLAVQIVFRSNSRHGIGLKGFAGLRKVLYRTLNETATWPSCGSNVPRLTSAFPINSSLIQRRSSHASHHWSTEAAGVRTRVHVADHAGPAQVNEGIVTGRAVDANNGILQGARVELQPKGVSTVTDAPGNFTIDNLAPGEYRLTVTFVGLASRGPERLDHRHGRAPTQRSRSDQS